MFGECSACKDKLSEITRCIPTEMEQSIVSFHQWGVTDGRMTKTSHESNLQQLAGNLNAQIPTFFKHVLVKRQQNAAFECAQSVNEEVVVLQFDFAENFAINFQDEVQSAHCHQKQVSIFTAVTWHTAGVSSHCIVSDNLCHDKKAARAYFSSLMTEIKSKQPSTKVIKIFSDGPSQFKNIYFLCFEQIQYAASYKIGVEFLCHFSR